MGTYKERLMKARQIGAQVLIQMQDNEFLYIGSNAWGNDG